MMLPNEQVDYLAKVFIALQVRALLGISFEQYLDNPGHYDRHALALHQGHGLSVQNGACRVIEIH